MVLLAELSSSQVASFSWLWSGGWPHFLHLEATQFPAVTWLPTLSSQEERGCHQLANSAALRRGVSHLVTSFQFTGEELATG